MTISTKNNESNPASPDTKIEKTETPAAPAEGVDNGDGTHDENGYEKVSPTEAPQEKPVEEKPVPEKPIEEPASGYGQTVVKLAEEKPEPEAKPTEKETPEQINEEEKLKSEIAESVKVLDKGYDKDKLVKFALENKFTKAQMEAYVKQIKEDDSAAQKAQASALASKRNSWNKELMDDPEFGGVNFDKNLDRVEKVLQKHFPNVKKDLTEKKGMLPPSFMKDFLGLAKALTPPNPLVNGEAPAPEEEETNFLDDMYK